MKQVILFTAVLLCAALVACSDDDDGGSDQNATQIGALSENATYAIVDDGGAGLYDYLATSVTEQCTEEQVDETFDGSSITGWKQIDDIELTGNDATATVIVLIDGEEAEQTWTFVREGESWRITSLPGLAECA